VEIFWANPLGGGTSNAKDYLQASTS